MNHISKPTHALYGHCSVWFCILHWSSCSFKLWYESNQQWRQSHKFYCWQSWSTEPCTVCCRHQQSVHMSTVVLMATTSFSLVGGYHHFGGNCRAPSSITLKTEVICSSETLVTTYNTTPHHRSEDHNRHTHRSKNSKSPREILYNLILIYFSVSNLLKYFIQK
jgi:hypothetical protein